MTLAVGDAAPDFTMQANKGRQVSLAGQRGRPFVLYFYPRAETPGCTAEACAFQEALAQLGQIGVDVIGVSKDGIKSLERFATAYLLQFPLASDQSGVAEAYGVWVKKAMYGRSYMGMERTTFLIDKAGRIARIWPKVKVEGHAAEVMEAARAL
jgi:peroxiredoxin Q/BCP